MSDAHGTIIQCLQLITDELRFVRNHNLAVDSTMFVLMVAIIILAVMVGRQSRELRALKVKVNG